MDEDYEAQCRIWNNCSKLFLTSTLWECHWIGTLLHPSNFILQIWLLSTSTTAEIHGYSLHQHHHLSSRLNQVSNFTCSRKTPLRSVSATHCPFFPSRWTSSKASFGITVVSSVVWVWVPLRAELDTHESCCSVPKHSVRQNSNLPFQATNFFAINITRARRMRAGDACISSDL